VSSRCRGRDSNPHAPEGDVLGDRLDHLGERRGALDDRERGAYEQPRLPEVGCNGDRMAPLAWTHEPVELVTEQKVPEAEQRAERCLP
jgi:hypothetical protein